MTERQTAFDKESRDAMAELRRRLGFKLWMFTGVEQDDFVVLSSVGDHFPIKDLDVYSWKDSFCAKMVAGKAPRVAPDTDAEDAYHDTPMRQLMSIKAFLGVPLTRSDGKLIGSLCAIDSVPVPDEVVSNLAIVEECASRLSKLFEDEISSLDQERRIDFGAVGQQRDSECGALGKEAWQKWLEIEQERALTHALSLGICTVKVNSDRLPAAVKCISELVEFPDVVARVDDDELGILLVNCTHSQVAFASKAIELFLMQARITCKVGHASHNLRHSLFDTVEAARKIGLQDPANNEDAA